MNGENDAPPVRNYGGARHDAIRAVNGDGYYGEIELGSEQEGAFFEFVHSTVGRAGAFGENNERHAIAEQLLGAFHGGAQLGGGRFVDVDLMCEFASVAHEGYASQRSFHHPAEIVVEKSGNREYIVGALMVGNENVGGVRVNILSTTDLDFHYGEDAENAGPYNLRPISTYAT